MKSIYFYFFYSLSPFLPSGRKGFSNHTNNSLKTVKTADNIGSNEGLI